MPILRASGIRHLRTAHYTKCGFGLRILRCSVAVGLAAAVWAGALPAHGHTGAHRGGEHAATVDVGAARGEEAATEDARQLRAALSSEFSKFDAVEFSSFDAVVNDPAVAGEWSAPFNVPAKGIHASVLPTGKVLWFSYPVNEVGSDAWLWDPTTGATTNVSLTTFRDVFCVAQSFLADGRILMTGGHVPGGSYGLGVKETDFFDPGAQTWTRGPNLTIERWYPTNVELANGKVLVFGGQKDDATPSETVDSFDPTANTLTRLPDSATKRVNSYPRLHLLPTGKISFTNQKRTELFDPATNTWMYVTNMNFGGRGLSDHSVLLPGLTKVLEFGGKSGSATSATNTAEIIDFSVERPRWRYTASMNFPRMYGNAVVLPDGKVLAVGGGRGPGIYDNPVYETELFDPATETWTVMAAQEAPRIYHSTAVLLPDGRVISAGQDKGSYQFTAEIYSPPYLFKGPRPQITAAPSAVGYNQRFTISTPDASSIGRVALIRPDSVTHSVNFDQRYVDLQFTDNGNGTLTAASPPGGNYAPPGPYMLFIVSTSGVPSVASWLRVGQPSGAAPTISRFDPTSGPVGTSVTITGTNLSGATSVTFNGVSASSFAVDSDGQIRAAVPSGASTGPIRVATPGGTATSSSSFAVDVPAPTISRFDPTSGPVGTSVTITGTNLSGATSVTFNGVSASSFAVDSETMITATVPESASTGPIRVATSGGSATSLTDFTVTAATYRETVLTDRPIGYWRLGETAGSAFDETGNSLGTYNGGVTRGVEGALLSDSNAAARFDGVDDYVSIPDNTALDVADVFTYELWLKRGAKQGVTQRIIHKGAGTASLGFGPSNRLVLIPGGASATAIATSTTTITDHVWHHVVVTKKGPEVHVYVDRVDVTAPGTNSTLANNSSALNIGRATSATAYFDGDLDEVAIYPVALTHDQVLNHFWAR
jgi:hypothetical protein